MPLDRHVYLAARDAPNQAAYGRTRVDGKETWATLMTHAQADKLVKQLNRACKTTAFKVFKIVRAI